MLERVEDLYWVAGLYEGEGCCWFQKGVRMELGSEDRDVIERLHRLVGVGRVRTQQLKSGKTFWRWRIMKSMDAEAVARRLYPLLSKRRQGQLDAVFKQREELPRGKKYWTHCSRGHELSPDNINPAEGRRRCRKCQALRAQAYRQGKTASAVL